MAEENWNLTGIIGLGAGAISFSGLVLGYSYAHSFFSNFGIPFFQLKMNSLDVIYRGVGLFLEPKVFGIFIFIIILAIIFSFIDSLLANILHRIIFISFFFYVLIMIALELGNNYGKLHAESIWRDGAGKKVFCRFKSNLDESTQPIATKLTTLAGKLNLRLLYSDNEITVLIPILTNAAKDRTVGESYVLPSNIISYCRIVGS